MRRLLAVMIGSTLLRENNQTEQQQTLNPRVRGSSPWRHTGDDLGFYDSRSFLCARLVWFSGHAGSALTPLLLGGRMLAGRPLVKNGPIGLDQLSGNPCTAPQLRRSL